MATAPSSRRKRQSESLFFNRELSWLDFNARVLDEAVSEHNPLLERLKFLAIFSNNLDEFFMIHMPGMRERIDEETGRTLGDRETLQNLRAVRQKLQPMLDALYLCYHELRGHLAKHGVVIESVANLNMEDRELLNAYFENEVFPVLTPLAVDSGHPFPYISNLSLSLAVALRDPRTGFEHFARVKVPEPPTLPRMVKLGVDSTRFVWMEDIIAAMLPRLFPGMEILSSYPFRVTRNADLELQEQSAADLLEFIAEELPKRRFGELERLEVDRNMPDAMRETLLKELKGVGEEVYTLDGPLDLGDLMPVAMLDRPELRDPPFTPGIPVALRTSVDIFSSIRQGDILLHHPYQSFDCVTDFLRAAADDPQTLAIKHTLYRTSGDSPILEALIDAADNGKQVACLVELKARFDEANNINWARQLEKAGVHVVYGLVGLKTHCKTTLVVRREEEGLRRYLHVGTGNYNPRTAATYTDVGLLTCDVEMGNDATELFNYLTGYAKQETYRQFLVAPTSLRKRLEELVARETEISTPQHPGRIIAKMNALVDPRLTRLLYAASQAGVQIDLLVRGMCCLRPGVAGISDNIRVVSVVGRFLEHSRVFYFQNGGDEQVFIGSADWMPRNLDRRIEVVAPVRNPLLQSTLKQMLQLLLRDNCQAWDLHSDGTYRRRRPATGETRVSAQTILLEQLAE